MCFVLIGFPASDPAPASRRCHRYAVRQKARPVELYEQSQTQSMESKQDAICEWVAREFNAIPQEWVRIILEHEHD